MRLNKTALRVLLKPFSMTWASLEGPLSGAEPCSSPIRGRGCGSAGRHIEVLPGRVLFSHVFVLLFIAGLMLLLYEGVCVWHGPQIEISNFCSWNSNLHVFFPGDIFSNSTEILRRFQKMTTKFKRKGAATVSAGGGRGSSLRISKRPGQ